MIYITKNKKDDKVLRIYTETLFKSILSDVVTLLVVIISVGIAILGEIYFNGIIIADIIAGIIFFVFLDSALKQKTQKVTKEELK